MSHPDASFGPGLASVGIVPFSGSVSLDIHKAVFVDHVIVIGRMTAPCDVAYRVRGRIGQGVSRLLTDAEVLTVGLAASCENAEALIEYVVDRQLAKELCRLRMHDVAITLSEFQALFTSFRPVRPELVAGVMLQDTSFKAFVEALQRQMQCTVLERDQKMAWGMAPVRVLTYVAFHAEADTEERVSCALGGVVRADMRRLEDLRASLEGDAMDVMSVGSSIAALVRCL